MGSMRDRERLFNVARGEEDRQDHVFSEEKLSPFSLGLFLALILTVVSMACTGEERDRSAVRAGESTTGENHWRAILEIQDRLDRVSALVVALRAVPPEDVGQLHELLRDSDSGLQDLERVMVIAAWADHDPEAATAWAIQGERGKSQNQAIEEAVRAWARVDPEAVIREYDISLLAVNHTGLLYGLIKGWFETGDWAALEAFVRDLGETDSRQRAVTALAWLRVGRDGAEEAIRWAESLPSTHEKYKMSVYRRVAREIAKTQPRMAADWCNRVCDSAYGSMMSDMIALEWAKDDGEATMEWLLTRPDGIETRGAVSTGYRIFLSEDPEAALAWMEQTTEEQRHDMRLQRAVRKYVSKRSWQEDQADVAIHWAGYLKNQDERETMLIQIAQRWRDRDEKAAEAWLEASPLSDESRMKAREPLKKIGRGARSPSS